MARRIAAFAADLLILAGFGAAIQILLAAMTGISLARTDLTGFQLEGLALLTISLPTWVYFIGFEMSALRATPGKMLFRLVVADDDGHPLRRSRVVLRTFVKLFPLEATYMTFFIPQPFVSAAGRGEFRFGFFIVLGMGFVYLLVTTWNEQHQSIHDLIAESVVIEKGKPQKWLKT